MTSYLLILALLLGLAPAFIAHGKGRNFLFWWIYGVVLGPVALIHAMMLRGSRQPALDAAPEARRARSDSPWPLLLRIASLFAIAIIAVAAYRIVVPPGPGGPGMQREVVISSDRTPPEQPAATPKTAGESETAAALQSQVPAAEAPPPQPSPTVRVTVRRDRLPPDENAAKQAAPAETAPAQRSTPAAPEPDKAAVPPPSPAAPQLERTLPQQPPATATRSLAPMQDVRALAARTAPAEPFDPSAAQRETSAKPSKASSSAKAKVAAKPSAAAPKPAAPEKPSLSDVTAMGETVQTVQQALAKRGYSPGPANGLAGRQTETAIRKFQADRGLKQTGAIDYEVLEALEIVGPRVFAFQPPPGATPGR
jgi:hypothetical protein